MNPDHERRLEALSTFVIGYARAGKTRRQFWEEFGWLAGDLEQVAFSDDADPEVRERYCDVLANADDAGFAVPDERLDEVMEG